MHTSLTGMADPGRDGLRLRSLAVGSDRSGTAETTDAPEDKAALYKLLTWLSPGYPIGAYTYSHGIEAAVAAGDVAGRAAVESWIRACLVHGAGWSDAVLLAQAWQAERRGDASLVDELIELAAALAPSAERLLETEAQGAAFADVTAKVWGAGGPAPYPVTVGRAAARHGLALDDTLVAYVHGFAANLVSASVRLVPLGQAEGQAVLAGLMADILALAGRAGSATLDEIGGCALGADIASMRHETLDVRLFRT